MKSVDELDGEIRRALSELGDAAGLAPRFDQLDRRPGGGRRPQRQPRVLVTAGVAALVVAGLIGLVAVRSDAPDSSTEAGNAASGPTATSVPPASLAPTAPEPTSPLFEMVAPLIPVGFTVLYVGGPPQIAVAYDSRGVRLDVTVDIDANVDVVQLGADVTDTAAGKITADGSMLLTSAGDVVRAEFSIAGCVCDLSLLDEYRPKSRDIVTGLAGALTPTQRTTIKDFRTEPIDTAQLRASVTATTQSSLNATIGGANVLAAWDFNVTVGQSAAGLSDKSMLTVQAIRTGTGHLTDDIANDPTGTIVATRWVNDWQLVVTSITGQDQQAPFTTADIESLLEQLTPLFADWISTGPSEPGCATHTVVKGDSINSIAERYNITPEELAAANTDLETLLQTGVDVTIPCPAVAVTLSSDQGRLEAFDHTNIPTDFSPTSTVRFATTGDSVYVISGGSDNQGGAILIERFNRITGASERSAQAPVPGCAGPVTISATLPTDPAAIGITCAATGTVGTLNVFTSQTNFLNGEQPGE